MLVVMGDTDTSGSVFGCVSVCVCAAFAHGNWTRVDKLLARAPTSDVTVMVWHIFVPRVKEFGL